MTAAEKWDDDFALDERKLCALSVIDSCSSSGWFTDAELETALENSSLRPEFALKLERKLDAYKEENKGRWPHEAMVLKRSFDDYLRHDIDCLAHAVKAERRNAAVGDGGPSSDLGLAVTR